jgi:hypothetical protein
MTTEEIIKKHLTLDKHHIKPCKIDSKDLLYDILKWLRNLTIHAGQSIAKEFILSDNQFEEKRILLKYIS